MFSNSLTQNINKKLTLLARSATAIAGSDSGTKSPFAFTVSNLPSMQKLHLSSGFQSIELFTGSSSLIRFNAALIFTAVISSCDVPLLFKISVADSLPSRRIKKKMFDNQIVLNGFVLI